MYSCQEFKLRLGGLCEWPITMWPLSESTVLQLVGTLAEDIDWSKIADKVGIEHSLGNFLWIQ